MATKKSKAENPPIPVDLQREADGIIREALHSLNDHLKELSQEVTENAQRYRKSLEYIRNGARRTSGRIV